MTQRSAKVHNKKKSLCEKSIILVANIIKLSSLSFITMSFGTTSFGATTAAKNNSSTSTTTATTVPAMSAKAVVDDDDDETKSELMVAVERSRSGHMRTRKPEAGGSERSRSYLMEPPPYKDSPPSYVIKKEFSTVDDMADDFISRKRTKINNMSELITSAPKHFSSKLPPKVKEVKLFR
ncbi:hypothetical protein PanWU01x14_250680 [Parasponia andersonii]|uniref:Uncharacterized protein n=1 Tax=Parasponia andersonii TaxID=3476 RepID=A0A2P5BCP5_PARAD|nr:hypothetical protein PanWU01x14_250680 [Parasponia andersonii]